MTAVSREVRDLDVEALTAALEEARSKIAELDAENALLRRGRHIPRYTEAQRFEAFLLRIEVTETCWLWRGYIEPHGYGQFTGYQRAHRLSYEIFVGPIPAGLVLDHLCSVRSCVNPAHLEPVTCGENNRRSWARRKGALCRNGHVYDIVRPDGTRTCRACRAEYMRHWRQARKAARSVT